MGKIKGATKDPELNRRILHQIFTDWKLYPPVAEHQFHPERKWRLDFAWPLQRVAIEVEGGIFGYTRKDGTKSKAGAHSSVTGILRDIDKYNQATMLGWRIIRCQPKDLFKESTLNMVKELLTKNR